jgi:hypothetical protein
MASTWPSSDIETPQYVWTQSRRWDAVRTPFEAGYVQTFSKWSTSKETFNMNWNHLSANGYTALTTHWEERKGGANSWEWTHPVLATTHTVRFLEDSLQVEMIAPNIWSVSLSVEEV